MATENKTNNKVRNFFRACGRGLVRCWDGIVWLGKGIIIAIALIAMFLFIYNPVSFLFWAIFFPKAAANLMWDMDIPVFSEVMQSFSGWIEKFLPFRNRKWFMKMRGIDNYSAKLQVKYYEASKQKIEVIKKMTDDAVQLLWKVGNANDWLNIANAGAKFTDAQFDQMMRQKCSIVISTYVSNNTPNQHMLHMLMNEVDDAWLDILGYCVRRYGLPAPLVKRMYEHCNEKAKKVCEDNLEIFADCKFVLGTQHGEALKEWGWACEKKPELCVEAQKCMDLSQYIRYFQNGLKLDIRAIRYFLSKGDLAMASYLFKQEYEAIIDDDEAMAYVAANPQLMRSWALNAPKPEK